MRKTIICILTVMALLCACGKEPATQEATTVPTTVQTEPTTVAVETTVPEESLPQETEPIALPEPSEDTLVMITDYMPDVLIDLKYASEDNFTGQVIYDFSQVYLRYGTVKKLMAVQTDLQELGLGLKIWDGFRPTSAQFQLWEVCPNPTYVANPQVGFSSHSRGNTVDLTLINSQGEELQMPTGFDDFSAMADRNYRDCPEEAAANAELLEILMEKHGFEGYFGEWWHFSDVTAYPVEKEFEPAE